MVSSKLPPASDMAFLLNIMLQPTGQPTLVPMQLSSFRLLQTRIIGARLLLAYPERYVSFKLLTSPPTHPIPGSLKLLTAFLIQFLSAVQSESVKATISPDEH